MERMSSWLIPYFIGYGIGFGIAEFSHHADNKTNKEEVQHIQAYNEELRPQLGNRIVAHLVLEGENHTYKFDSQTEAGKPEVCVGSYEITRGHAVTTGNLACTETVKVGK